MPDITNDALAIRGFADAVAQAFALHRQFGYCHGAACLDDSGRLRDLTVFTDPEVHTVDSALDWAFCMVVNDERFTRMVVFSTGAQPVVEPSEGDLALFRVMRNAFAGEGVEVVDWIRCDGENVRSLAFTEREDAWQRS